MLPSSTSPSAITMAAWRTILIGSLVRFEKVPAKVQDLDQLIRWQVRKAGPFPIDEAQISYVPGLEAADGQEFIVALARRSVIEEYEGLCAEAGATAGLVDLASFNVVNANNANTSATIQNRVITLDSDHPINSK